MKNDYSNKKNDILATQRNIAIIIASISFLTTFLLTICLLNKDIQTIIMPSSLSQMQSGGNSNISYSNKKVYNSYLEAFTRDVIYTMLNLSPNNVEYAEKSILSFTHSSTYGTLKQQLETIKTNITSKKFSTAFYPVSIAPDSDNLLVVVEGNLYTYLGQKEVANQKKTYEIKYDYTAGRLTISGFNEVEEEEIAKKNE
jgi:conjugal transfer pilus assembly protein TraE